MNRWKDRLRYWAIALALGTCVVLVPLGLPAVRAHSPFLQSSQDSSSEPSPDSPFEAGRSPNRYYADAIDDLVARAIVDAYLGNAESLRARLDALRDEDEARRREGRPETGLSPGLRALYHGTLTGREAVLAAQKAALAEAADPAEKALISRRLGQDALTQADALYHKSVVTRAGRVLNRMLRSVNLTSLVLDPLMAPAIDAAAGVVFHFGEVNAMSAEERKALVLYEQFLARHPEDPEVERVEKDVARLRAKRRKALLAQQIAQGEQALETGNFWTAERSFESALALDAVSDEAQQGLQRVKHLREQQADHLAEMRRTSPESLPLGDPADETPYYDLLLVTTRRQPIGMRAAADTLASRYPAGPLWDMAMDVTALAYEMEGQKEKAHESLRAVARSGRSSSRQARAGLLLENSHYNQLVAIRAAERQHLKETLSYILGGKQTLEQAIIHSPASILLYGTPAAIPIGAATAAGAGIRAVHVLTGNPVSRSAVIEAAGQYVRENPRGDAHYREVCLLLAAAYEKEDRLDRALYYSQEAGVDADEIRELEGRVAKLMLKRGEGTSPTQRAGQFLAILTNYPETEAAREAGRKLRELLAPQYQGLRLSKKFLQEHPAIAREGLRLRPVLLDGNPDNGEIAADGVTLLETGQIVITFDDWGGTRSEVYNLDRRTAERVLRMLREGMYEKAFHGPGETASLFSGQPDHPAFLFARNPAEDRVDREPELLLRPYEFLGETEKGDPYFLPFPEIAGTAGMSGVRLEGLLPYEPFGTRLSIGLDDTSPFVGAEVPVPEPFPFTLRINATPDTRALPSISPQIRLNKEKMPDASLYE